MTYEEIQDLIDTNLASATKIPALKHREVEHALLDYIQSNIAQSGDIKRVKCDLTYLEANFESDGLGKNLRLGWAICNGNNGTDNLAGRVGVGYGLGYSVLGQTGGSKDAVVVAHTHTFPKTLVGKGSGGIGDFASLASNIPYSDNTVTNESGVSGTNMNMQPYIINLYIMKL